MAAKRSVKDKEMASRLKKLGVRHTTGACPICHRRVSLGHLYNHIVTHKGG